MNSRKLRIRRLKCLKLTRTIARWILTKSNSVEFIISPTVADPNENKIKIVIGAVEKIQNGGGNDRTTSQNYRTPNQQFKLRR